MGVIECPLCATLVNEATSRCPACGCDPHLAAHEARAELRARTGTSADQVERATSPPSPWTLGGTLAIAGGIAGLVVAALVVTQGSSWVADILAESSHDLDPGSGPENPMVLLGTVWTAAALAALVVPAISARRRTTAVLAFVGAGLGFVGVLVANAGAPLHDWGEPYWLGDPSDHAVLAVLWLVAALPLAAAGVLTLERPVDSGARTVTDNRSVPQTVTSRLNRSMTAMLNPARLASFGTGIALGLALLVGLRGETWAHAHSLEAQAQPNPMAWLSVAWGAAAAAACAAALLLHQRRRRASAAGAAAAAALGFVGALLAGFTVDAKTAASLLSLDSRLADPAQRSLLCLYWVAAAVPLVAAAALALARRP